MGVYTGFEGTPFSASREPAVSTGEAAAAAAAAKRRDPLLEHRSSRSRAATFKWLGQGGAVMIGTDDLLASDRGEQGLKEERHGAFGLFGG